MVDALTLGALSKGEDRSRICKGQQGMDLQRPGEQASSVSLCALLSRATVRLSWCASEKNLFQAAPAGKKLGSQVRGSTSNSLVKLPLPALPSVVARVDLRVMFCEQ